MSFVKLPHSIRNFDFFAKPLKDFRVQTVAGALVTILCFGIITLLFCAEFLDFLSSVTKQEIIVDISRDHKLSIAFDISFEHLPCEIITVDTMDISGDQQMDIEEDIKKIPIEKAGQSILPNTSLSESAIQSEASSIKDPDYCGSCYGAETNKIRCCNSCASVLEAYRIKNWVVVDPQLFSQCLEKGASAVANEGCRLVGHIGVNRVAGSFHFAPGHSYTRDHAHVHDLSSFRGAQFNLSHKIDQLRFGDTYPGHRNALDGSNWTSSINSPMLSYFLKLVPTIYQHKKGNMFITTNQYSVTSQARSTPLSGASDGVPGVFFNFEISPLLVKLSVKKKSFLHFLTNTFAIIGGTFTVFGILDTLLYRSFCFFEKLK